MPLKTEIPPHGIVQKESLLNRVTFNPLSSQKITRTEKGGVMRNLLKQKCSAKRPHTMDHRARDV